MKLWYFLKWLVAMFVQILNQSLLLIQVLRYNFPENPIPVERKNITNILNWNRVLLILKMIRNKPHYPRPTGRPTLSIINTLKDDKHSDANKLTEIQLKFCRPSGSSDSDQNSLPYINWFHDQQLKNWQYLCHIWFSLTICIIWMLVLS